MKQSISIRIIVAIVVAVFTIGTWMQGGRFEFGWLKFFSAAVTASTIVLAAWDFWIWRTPIVQRLPGVPRSVRGTWKGTLTSFWVDPATGSRPAPKTVYLVVRQTATLVTVKLLTNESRSSSALAKVSSVDGSFLLTYIYLNKPELQFEERSRMHHGSSVFDVYGCPARRLKGRYWTDRDSKGELEFAELSGKLADDFDEASSFFRENA